jgi:hypothetical protein
MAPNPLARRVRLALLSEFADWEKYAEIRESGDIEIAVPAPKGSSAGSLVVLTKQGEDIWVRYAPAYMAYAVDDELELIAIVKQLLSERASFALILEKGERKETTLLQQNETPELKPEQNARVVSWFGTYDREVA